MLQDELIGSAREIANAWLDAAGVRPKAQAYVLRSRPRTWIETVAAILETRWPATVMVSF